MGVLSCYPFCTHLFALLFLLPACSTSGTRSNSPSPCCLPRRSQLCFMCPTLSHARLSALSRGPSGGWWNSVWLHSKHVNTSTGPVHIRAQWIPLNNIDTHNCWLFIAEKCPQTRTSPWTGCSTWNQIHPPCATTRTKLLLSNSRMCVRPQLPGTTAYLSRHLLPRPGIQQLPCPASHWERSRDTTDLCFS